MQHLVETLAKCDGKPVPSRRLLAASVCNCVALYLFGQRHDLDDPRRRSVDRQVEAFFRAGASTPVEFLPAWLRRLARLLLPDCRSAFVERFAQQVTEFSRWALSAIDTAERTHEQTERTHERTAAVA